MRARARAAAGVIQREDQKPSNTEPRKARIYTNRWNDIEGALSRGVILLEYKNITLVITWRMDYINCS